MSNLPALLVGLLLAGAPEVVSAQTRITTPAEEFGFNLGDDYHLANYTQLEAYWRKLAGESDRMALEVIGESAEGRPIYMAVLTSPENHARLEYYRDIARRLTLAEGIDEQEARALAAAGRPVVWIDGGLHANETLGAQQLMELVYQMVSGTDAETLRFLDEVILLAVCVNPDGLELVADWYMREPVPSRRSLANLPALYQKYSGHDNNRDFYMSSQPETEAINRVLYREWFPQIVYNHHQSAPEGTIMFAPPFRDPFNYNFDPLIVSSIDLVAGAMHARFLAEGKPGVTMRSGAAYSTWWNGGLRTTPYFHNMIGLLTETTGSPTPMEIPLAIHLQAPRGDYPAPAGPQRWHFRQAIEYAMTANRAVLDVASRYGDTLLYHAWRMGMNSIERGGRDTWTLTPRRTEEARRDARAAGLPASSVPLERLHRPEWRDPRGYVIPADQPDFPTATKFVNALIRNGVAVHRATAPFRIDGRDYPAGSYVVKTAQAFRPHVLDMFEPQDYPDDFAYPGAAPTPPYDTAGWTLAYQMGIRFDRILDGFDGPFEPIAGLAPVPPGAVRRRDEEAGFLASPAANDVFIAMNRLLQAGESVLRLGTPYEADGRAYPAGAVYIPANAGTAERLEALAGELGLAFEAVASAPRTDAARLRPVRIGLWDQYGGSEASGWTRFILESFEFPFEVVFPRTLDGGDLRSAFDVLVFVSGGIPADDRRSAPGGEAGGVPPEFAERLGRVSVAATVPHLREFLERGGTVVAIGASTVLAEHLGLPLAAAPREYLPNGASRPLPRERFYIPGSILRAEVDPSHPLAYGLDSAADVMFDSSPAFRLDPDAPARGVQAVAWFDADPLRSGWAWGQEHLEGAAAAVDAAVGDGRLVLFGPEILFRAQPHGTFKFFFNSLFHGHSEAVRLE